MSKYRNALPLLKNILFMSDGGLETTMIYHEHLELPLFASIDLLRSDEGTQTLYRYYCRFAELARQRKLGFLMESASWRASPDWGQKLGYDQTSLAGLNRRAIELLVKVREQYETATSPMVICGVLGPRGDGYRPEHRMTAAEAAAYHSWQIRIFADTQADRSGGGFHHELPGRSHRHCGGGTPGPDAGGHFLHGGNRWSSAQRPIPAGSH